MSKDPSTVEQYDEDEISLVDIIRFFKRRWRSVGSVTIPIAAIISTVSLTQPSSYQRSATLQIADPFLLLDLLGQSTDSAAPPQIAVVDNLGAWALTALTKLDLDAGVQSPNYNKIATQLTFELTAANLDQLEAIPTTLVIEGLAEQWQVPLEQAIATRTQQLEVQQQQAQQTLSQLESAIAQLPAENIPRLEALEAQRAIALREQAALEFQAEYLAELRNNLEQASQDLLPIEIAAEGDIQENRTSLLQVMILAVVSGFMVATLLVIIVEQWPHWQAELAAANAGEKSAQPRNQPSPLD
ncbi:MAG: hypothetical protein ACPGVO_19555 [Spirulinaceae cyanobacterium]